MVVGSCPCCISLVNARNLLSLRLGLGFGGGVGRGHALEELLEGLDYGVKKLNYCQCINHADGGFGLPPEPLE